MIFRFVKSFLYFGETIFNGKDHTTSINIAIYVDLILILGGIGCQIAFHSETRSEQISNRSRVRSRARARARRAETDHLLLCFNASVKRNIFMTTTIILHKGQRPALALYCAIQMKYTYSASEVV